MGDKTHIEWTDATWNPVAGCSIHSPGCAHCYAMPMAERIQRMSEGKAPSHYAGTTVPSKAGPVWTGHIALAPDHIVTAPLRWKRPRRIFVNSMGDLFHEAVPDAWIDQVFAVMALCPQHTFQVLTKRAKRMREYFTLPPRGTSSQFDTRAWKIGDQETTIANSHPAARRTPPYLGPTHRRLPLENVWLGVSAERQKEADDRIPDLLATPAAKRFVSAEPLLGPIDFRRMRYETQSLGELDALDGERWFPGAGSINSSTMKCARLDWIIVGGESGPGARPLVIGHAREIVQQCHGAGVPVFVKQLGARPVNREGEPHLLRHRKGADMAEWPEDLRMQEWPK